MSEKRFTDEDRKKALSASLTAIASRLGYTVQRNGQYHNLKEMDSLVIYNDRTWFRWSGKGNKTSGNAIDFVIEHGGITSVPEAIHFINGDLDSGIVRKAQTPPSQPTYTHSKAQTKFELPPHTEGNKMHRIYAYLTKSRGLSTEIVYFFTHNKLLYEDRDHHNAVFVAYDKNHVPKAAFKRGTVTVQNGKGYKRDVSGSDKNYGINIPTESSHLKVFEAAIDLMSYMDITKDYESNKLVLGMTNDKPLEQFLKDYPHIKDITFCLDNDIPGRTAVLGDGEAKEGYLKKYADQGYRTHAEFAMIGKDFNELLCSVNNNVKGKEYGESTDRKKAMQFYHSR